MLTAYLKIGGVTGEVLTPGLEGDFALSDFSLGASRDASGLTFDPMVVILSDALSPGVLTLLADAANGALLPSVEVDLVDSSGGKPLVVDTIVLTDVSFADAQVTGAGTGLAFDYASIAITPQNTAAPGLPVSATVATTGTLASAAGTLFAALGTGVKDKVGTLVVDLPDGTGSDIRISSDIASYSLPLTGDHFGPLTVQLLKPADSQFGVTLVNSLLTQKQTTWNLSIDDAAQTTITFKYAIIASTYDAGVIALKIDYQTATITSHELNADGSLGAEHTIDVPGQTFVLPSDGIDGLLHSSVVNYLKVAGATGPGPSAGSKTIDSAGAAVDVSDAYIGTGYSFGIGTGYSFGIGSNHTRPVLDPIVVTLDGSSTAGIGTLLADAANGTVIPGVELYVMESKKSVSLQIALTDAVVVSAQQAGGGIQVAFDYLSASVTQPIFDSQTGELRTTNTGIDVRTLGATFLAPPAPAFTSAFASGTGVSAYLAVAGDVGPVTALPFAGDFHLTGFSFGIDAASLAPTPGALAVTLDGGANEAGVSTLLADSLDGTIIPSVTLSVTAAGSTTVAETIQLSQARVTSYTEQGGHVAASFSYANAAVTTFDIDATGTVTGSHVSSIAGPSGTDAFSGSVAPGTSPYRLFLSVSGVAGEQTGPAFAGSFALSGYGFGAGMDPGGGGSLTTFAPLVVTLAHSGTDGAHALFADANTGMPLDLVELDVADATGTILDRITLNRATVLGVEKAGGGTAVAFSYQSIRVEPATVSGGTTAPGQVVDASVPGSGSFTTPPFLTLPAAPATAGTAFLTVLGGTGPVAGPLGGGAFQLAGYTLTPGHLTVDLGASTADAGVTDFYQDLLTSQILPGLRLDITDAPGSSTVIEQLVLSNAAVTGFRDPVGDVTVDFSYQTLDAPISVTCFCAGTRIRTPAGDIAVEQLTVGDLVETVGHGAQPVRWIGRQTVSTRFGDKMRVLPIRIKAGALGEGLPVRDLRLSPAHAVKVDDILVQAGALVNGSSILREADVPEVFTYYHVELDMHGLLLAEGVPAESFVDNASRENFDNWEEHGALFPGGRAVAEMPYPRAQSARQVPMAMRARLAGLAAGLEEGKAAA